MPRRNRPEGTSLDESQLAATHRPFALSLQGTLSSKKKKQAKLKRVMGALRKNARKERGTGAESFAAVQLLNDPQVCCLLSCDRRTAAKQTSGALPTAHIWAEQP